MKENLITLKESAKILKLNIPALKDLIVHKKFKTYKKGKVIKLNKDDLLEWLSNMIEVEQKDLAIRRVVVRFTDFFSLKNIFLGIEANNKYDAIAEVAMIAKELKIVRNHRWLYEAILAREEIVSTAVGRGVALLHTRAPHPSKIKKPTIIFARSQNKIDFDAIDGKPVDIFFILLLRDEREHLFSLSYINRFMLKEENIDKIREAETKEEIFTLLSGYKDF